ncbi:MAG TPA: GAF domain-containing sensor histidine kinase [Terriglobales bacterium]|nr:GAF domain-containing sensor histidine kinase [Terriglobales bacterium]
MHNDSGAGAESAQVATGIDEKYVDETARLTLARLPYAIAGLLLSFGLAWIFEHRTHPERFALYAVLFAAEMAAWFAALLLPRAVPMRPARQLDAVLIAAIAVELMMCSYHIIAHGEGEVLGLAMAYTHVAAMLLFHWGATRQALLVGTGFAAYALSLATTVSTAAPAPLHLIGQATLGVLTCFGSYFTDRWRRQLFHQTLQLQEANESLRRVNEALQRQMIERQRASEEIRALLDIARDLAGALESIEIVRRVQKRIAEILPCDRVATFYRDPESTDFRVIAHHGIPAEQVADALTLRFGPDVSVSSAVRAGQTLVMNDPAQQSWLPAEVIDHFGIEALAGVPLMARGSVVGVLVVSRHSAGRPFDDHQIRLLEAIAAQIAVAVETAEMFRSKRAEAAVSAGLARAAQELIASLSTPTVLERLCRLTTELLNCDVSYTFLHNAESGTYSCVASHGTSTEEIETLRLIELPQPAVQPALDGLGDDDVAVFDSSALRPAPARAGSHIYVALRRGDALIGFQVAGWNTKLSGGFRRLRQIAKRIGQLGSLTLENARLLVELGRANRLKSDFLATVSHEFRTPLNVILGYNDLMLEDAFGPLTDMQRETLDRMRTNAKQLLDLINAILDVTRLEGKSPVLVEPVQITAMLEDISEEVRELRASKPEVSFVIDVADDLPLLHTDTAKLKLVLKNLISNAIKFTDRGVVTISAAVAAGGVELRVADTGIGIASDAQESIFEPFCQVEGVALHAFAGVGLGLYIVRRLLDLLHGELSLESTPGEGSCFSVWLPAVAAIGGAGESTVAEPQPRLAVHPV